MRKSEFQNKDNNLAPDTSAPPKFFYGYIVAAAGFLVWLVGATYTPAFGVTLKPMLDETGWSRAEASLGYSLSIVVSGALAIIMGRLTDKIGPRVVVAVFGSFFGICYLLMSQVSELWQFQLNYALVGSIGASTVGVPVMSTIARWFVKKRGLMTGIVQAGVGIGGLIIAPLTAWLIINYGWRLSYVILGLIALLGIVTAGLFLRKGPQTPDELRHDNGELEPIYGESQIAGITAKGYSLREALNVRQFWVIIGLFFVFGFCRSAFLPHTAAYVQDKGFSLVDGANVLAALTVSSIFGRLVMGRVADTIGNRRTLFISEVFTTFSLALGLIVTDLWGLYLYGIIFGFGWGAQAVLRFAVASEEFGLASIGVLMGVFGFAEAIAASIGSYFAGYIFDTVGNYQPAFWLGIAISIAGIVLTKLQPATRTRTG